nr:hypothetical protein [Paenibacillus monticola]
METDQRIEAVVGAAPDALDTLKEIGDALNNDPNFAATVINALALKLNISSYTAADVLAKLLTVDTDDSGLNASTLQSKTLAQIVQGTLSFAVTTGTATAYIAALTPALAALNAGIRLSFKAHVASGDNPTLNANGLGARPIRKPNGLAAKLTLNGVYTVVYDGTDFILQGEGGEYGTAIDSDVVAGKTIGTDNGLVPGTLIDRRATDTIPGEGTAYLGNGQLAIYVPTGAYESEQRVTAVDTDFIPANFRADKETFGMQGSLPVITNGGDPAIGVGQWPDGALAVYPAEGYRKGGPGAGEIKVSPAQLQAAYPSLLASNVKRGVPLAGLVGTMPEYHEQYVFVTVPAGTSVAVDSNSTGLTFSDFRGAYMNRVGSLTADDALTVFSGGWRKVQPTSANLRFADYSFTLSGGKVIHVSLNVINQSATNFNVYVTFFGLV